MKIELHFDYPQLLAILRNVMYTCSARFMLFSVVKRQAIAIEWSKIAVSLLFPTITSYMYAMQKQADSEHFHTHVSARFSLKFFNHHFLPYSF